MKRKIFVFGDGDGDRTSLAHCSVEFEFFGREDSFHFLEINLRWALRSIWINCTQLFSFRSAYSQHTRSHTLNHMLAPYCNIIFNIV